MGWCLVRCLIFDLSISISVVSVDAVVDCCVCGCGRHTVT
jgi:hypothetical protein